jgi:hypothetical protein
MTQTTENKRQTQILIRTNEHFRAPVVTALAAIVVATTATRVSSRATRGTCFSRSFGPSSKYRHLASASRRLNSWPTLSMLYSEDTATLPQVKSHE